MTFRYTLYGLILEADREIGGLRETAQLAPADVRVWIANRPPDMQLAKHDWHDHPAYISRRPYDRGENPMLRILESADKCWIQLQYQMGIAFVIDPAGTAISITGSEELLKGGFEAFLIGPVMGFVMRLRGTIALHASGAALGDRALLLCAHSGMGKSTLASALVSRGARLITDDIAPLTWLADSWYVEAGGERVRLWADSAEMLGVQEGLLTPILANYAKRYQNAPLVNQRVALKAIYLLNRAEIDAPQIALMQPSAALIALVDCTYANYLIDREMRIHEFKVLHQIVTNVSVFTLDIPADLARLDVVCDALRAHFAAT